MSLLFDSDPSATAGFILKKEENQGGFDTVCLGKNLWNSINPADTTRLCISIQPLSKTKRDRTSLAALTCWAVPDEKVCNPRCSVRDGGSYLLHQVDDLAIPPEWCKAYGHIFPQAYLNRGASKMSHTLSVTRTEPSILTEVIVVALSLDAYQMACGRDSLLESWFSEEKPILRHRSVHTLRSDRLRLNGHDATGPPKSYTYRLDMVEPVLQGFVQKGTTRFIVTLVECHGDTAPAADALAEARAESDDEGIEIDEGFLANSALSSAPIIPSVENGHLSPEGYPSVIDSSGFSDPATGIAFRIKPLVDPLDGSLDHCTLYLRTVDLGRTGFLNGDWVSELRSVVDRPRQSTNVSGNGLFA